MGNSIDDLVSTSELARVFGKSTRWVNDLTHDEVLEKVKHGTYRLPDSVQRYIEHLKKQYEEGGGIDYAFEKAAHERVKRKKAEIELAAMEGQMHSSADVETVMNDMVGNFRAKMLALPSILAPQLVGITEIPVVFDMLSREIHDALTELSEYDPQTFLAISEDYVEVDDDESSG
ncbi:type IV toxin-antitoxin system AbiEi family antitoxin domain-containing protein [Tumebacillus flagellatus]|uniref:Terminase small subunit n=1 Tax=Tumebacillus flagellatus TaxID=1157490 RepID=A0A074LXE1_9BACL|nr:type IV toxin-antitoxin system AbiEi family antitoxin domain-containing protein [Tumebacillus flagellatus]KEO84768.1 hypothetical protein EL26_01795 [Tumebacillus flagellatus]